MLKGIWLYCRHFTMQLQRVLRLIIAAKLRECPLQSRVKQCHLRYGRGTVEVKRKQKDIKEGAHLSCSWSAV